MPASAYVVFGVLLLFGFAALAFSWIAFPAHRREESDVRPDRERQLERSLEQAEEAIRAARELLHNGR